jgi:hypothetical protein
MANMGNNKGGTLFMALEAGASWPRYVRRLRKSASQVQAVVQVPGEPAEQFASRAIERWQTVLGSSVPPHRFVLGASARWDAVTSCARQRLARAVLDAQRASGMDEIILWGGNIDSVEDQGQLLALAGALVEGPAGSNRGVRVLFREPDPLTGLPISTDSTVARMHVA